MRILSCCLLILCCSLTPVFSQSYDELIDASFQFLEKNDLFGAEESLKQALRKEPANPRNVLLLSNLGTIQKGQGKLDEALLSYNLALGRTPDNVALLRNRAKLYTELAEYEKAIADYSALLVLSENDEDALYERGMLYLAQKDYMAAESDFEKILTLNPQTLNGRKGYANLSKLRKEYEEAEKIYYFLIERVPDDPGLYLGRAELYLLMEKNGRASADINKAIALQEKAGVKDPYAYVLRAQVKMRQYEAKSAAKDIEKAVELGYDKTKADGLLKLSQ